MWTVLSTPTLIATEAFRIPPGQRDAVQVVHLPLQPSRLLPGVLVGKDADDLIALNASPRQHFLSDLSEREKEITEVLRQQPYATNDVIASVLGKSPKTIENQFSSIYTKLAQCFDVDVTTARKRQVLLDVLQGRV